MFFLNKNISCLNVEPQSLYKYKTQNRGKYKALCIVYNKGRYLLWAA